MPGSLSPRFTWKKFLLWSDVATFLLIFGFAFNFSPPTFWKTAGLSVATAGFGLWMLARYQLGHSFSATAQARHLISTGLYRRFRHPIYYFGGLAHLGVLVALQIWWIPLIWAAYASAIQWKRMSHEDRVLEEAFGKEFRTLRRNAWI